MKKRKVELPWVPATGKVDMDSVVPLGGLAHLEARDVLLDAKGSPNDVKRVSLRIPRYGRTYKPVTPKQWLPGFSNGAFTVYLYTGGMLLYRSGELGAELPVKWVQYIDWTVTFLRRFDFNDSLWDDAPEGNDWYDIANTLKDEWRPPAPDSKLATVSIDDDGHILQGLPIGSYGFLLAGLDNCFVWPHDTLIRVSDNEYVVESECEDRIRKQWTYAKNYVGVFKRSYCGWYVEQVFWGAVDLVNSIIRFRKGFYNPDPKSTGISSGYHFDKGEHETGNGVDTIRSVDVYWTDVSPERDG